MFERQIFDDYFVGILYIHRVMEKEGD